MNVGRVVNSENGMSNRDALQKISGIYKIIPITSASLPYSVPSGYECSMLSNESLTTDTTVTVTCHDSSSITRAIGAMADKHVPKITAITAISASVTIGVILHKIG